MKVDLTPYKFILLFPLLLFNAPCTKRPQGPISQSLFSMTKISKISDKSDDNQSEARISVAYNKNGHVSLMTSFVKHPPAVIMNSLR